MTRKFCFVCGRETEKLKEGRCDRCYGPVNFPKTIEVTVCGRCGAMKLGNKWTEYDIKKFVSKKLKNKELEVREINKKLLISSAGRTAEASLHKNIMICATCSKKSSGYYEAVIQLRGFEENELEIIRRVIAGWDKKTFYRMERVKDGVNIKIGNKSMVNGIAKAIKAKLPCKEKKSSKLITRIDGRNVYRQFVLLRRQQS